MTLTLTAIWPSPLALAFGFHGLSPLVTLGHQSLHDQRAINTSPKCILSTFGSSLSVQTRAQAGVNTFLLLCSSGFRRDCMEEEVGITALLPTAAPVDTCE